MNQKLIKDRLLLVPGSLIILAAAFLYPDYPNRTRTYLLIGAGLLLVLAGVLYRAKHEADFLKYIKSSLIGFGLFLVALTIWFLALLKIPDIFSHLDKTDKSMDNLWYFIYRDFRLFLGCLVGILLLLIFLLPFYSRYKIEVFTSLLIPLGFFSTYIIKGISILLNSDNILHPEIATTSWSSSAHYINHIPFWFTISISSVWFFLLFLIRRRETKRLSQQTSRPE